MALISVVHFLPKFPALCSNETINGNDLLYHHAKFGAAGTSPAVVEEKSPFFVCYLSVTLLNSRVCECDFGINARELRTTLISLDGKGL